MKKKLTVRFLTIIFILCIGTLFVSATNASDETPTLSIAGFSLSLKESIFINCKVSHTNLDVEYVDDIQILVWEEVPEAYTANNNPSAVLSWLGTDTSGYESYRYTNITAKEMTKELYLCAYVKIGDTEIYSAPKKYSILTYAYNKINATSPNAKLVKLCQDLLDYGASAQTYLGYNTDFLANDEVYKITVSGGTLADGFTSGIYQNGDTVVLTANTPEVGYAFLCWKNSLGEEIGTEDTVTIKVCKNETYTPIYYKVYDGIYSEGLAYTLSDDGTYYSVSGIGTCSDSEIIIPERYKNLPVERVYGFYKNEQITSLKVPASVKIIPNSGFSDCPNLKTIDLSCSNIGEFSFSHCNNLTDVTLNNNVKSIGHHAFYCCDKLENVVMSDSVTSIASSAFSHCTNLTYIKMSDNITFIGAKAFEYCENLSSIQLPSGITTIEEATFLGCVELKALDIPQGVTYIGNSAFSSCESITELVIPNGVIELGTYVFCRTYNLENLTLPDTLQSVGKGAFESCGVNNIHFVGDESKWCQIQFSSGLAGFPSDVTIYLNGVIPTTYTIPDGVTSIPPHAFHNFKELEIIIIPESVINIGAYAFANCRNLKNIDLPDTLNYIGEYSFSHSGIENIEIPLSLTEINSDSFCGCANLTEITIPSNIKKVGEGAFSGCKILTLVKFEEGVESVGEDAFAHCYNLKYIVIPTSISCLEKDAFGSCYYVDKILFLGDTIEKWETIEINPSNSEFLSADVLFYSDIKPNENCDEYWCYKDDEIFLWKHTKITVEEVKANCTSIGYSEYSYCSDCGEVLKLREILPRTNHTYVNGICSICHSTGDDTDDNISINMPTLSPEYAAALLGFLYNDGDLDQTIIENNDWYKIMIGTYEGDDWADKAKSLAVFAMDVTQDMSKNANKNADYAKEQLLIYLEKHLKDISAENLTNEAYDQIANYFVDQLIDIASSINPAIGVANAMGEVITGVSDLESCVEEIKEVVNVATNVVVLTYEQEFGGRYEYFQIYIYNRKFYTSNADSNFENQMLREQIYITQKYKEAGAIDLLSFLTGKESFLVNLDVIDNFAEYIYQLNLYANSIS